MYLTKFLLFSFILFGLETTVQAQENILVSGGEAKGSGGSVSFSVGQIFYTSNNNINGSVGQGVQQPLEISVVIGIKEAKDISLQCSVYPNPTADFLTLKVEDYEIQHLTYKLYDINGKLLENKNVKSNVMSIEMQNLAPACYFLKVYDNQKEVKTFKIIKN